MSDKMRWRYGDINPVVAAVDSSTVIEIGDLVWQDVDDAKPASMVPCDPREAGREQYWESERLAALLFFAKRFLGVAMQWSRSGDTDPIRVAATGVFEFDCPSGTFELGDLVSPHIELWTVSEARGVGQAGTAKCLQNQAVAPVTTSKYAIGRVARRVATAATGVLVDVRSTVMTGGVEGSSPSGV